MKARRMAKSWNFVFVLVWLSAILGAGIHLFSKGFLLTRIAQTDYSSCVRYEDIRCGTGGGDNGDGVRFMIIFYVFFCECGEIRWI